MEAEIAGLKEELDEQRAAEVEAAEDGEAARADGRNADRQAAIQELEQAIAEKERELSVKQTRRDAAAGKTWEQKQDEKAAGKEGEWGMIKVIERQLLIYACFDFFIQLYFFDTFFISF